MLYKKLSKFRRSTVSVALKNFDFWLATLPADKKSDIKVSDVSRDLCATRDSAENLLNKAASVGILEKYVIVQCPACHQTVKEIRVNEIDDVLMHVVHCDKCGKEESISLDELFVCYRLIENPDGSEEEIAKEIRKRMERNEMLREKDNLNVLNVVDTAVCKYGTDYISVDLSEDGTMLDVNLCNDRCSNTYMASIARVDHCDLDELKAELDKRNIGYCF